MRRGIILISVLVLLSSSLQLHGQDNSPQKKPPSTSATHTKQYGGQPADTNQRSRKCGIYSGICPMSRTAEVGDYCICHTPSGPIHGVVVP